MFETITGWRLQWNIWFAVGSCFKSFLFPKQLLSVAGVLMVFDKGLWILSQMCICRAANFCAQAVDLVRVPCKSTSGPLTSQMPPSWFSDVSQESDASQMAPQIVSETTGF